MLTSLSVKGLLQQSNITWERGEPYKVAGNTAADLLVQLDKQRSFEII